MTTHVLNTLFVQTQGAYLRLDHDTVRVEVDGARKVQVPLHHLGGIVLFGNVLISPFLLHQCADDGREVAWFEEHGRFKARLVGPVSGNVLLRRAQHRALDDPARTLTLARAFVAGKLRNTRVVMQRAQRERAAASPLLGAAIVELGYALRELDEAADLNTVRGIEGQAAARYFAAFGEMLLASDVTFEGRTRRPPRDPVNAMLSFVYALLLTDCTGALEGVGLDPQVGYLHALRPGRHALALDLMEEFRTWLADRLVLTLVNRRQVGAADFEARPGGAVYLNEKGRRTVLTAYQQRKQETVRHPLVKQAVPIGLLPHLQARLLARYLREDLPRYVPFQGK